MNEENHPASHTNEFATDVRVAKLIDAQLQWGIRGASERREFEQKLQARLEARSGWRAVLSGPGSWWTGAAVTAAAALLALFVWLSGTYNSATAPPALETATSGTSFLALAYYESSDGDFVSGAGNQTGADDETYLSGELQLWSEGLEEADATDSNPS